jgi:aromatic-L-amino-acid decarboxylase
MKSYDYKIVDLIVSYYEHIESEKSVSAASRKEMDTIFFQEASEKAMPSDKVLDFLMENVMPNSNISIHPKAFSFAPGPSNFIGTMADSLATGFNIFAGGWIVSPAAVELEIVTLNWLLKMVSLPVTKGGGSKMYRTRSLEVLKGGESDLVIMSMYFKSK